MTLVHFDFNNSYLAPSYGRVVFMPHRKHAANETVVLPKPFDVALENGETTVNLEPTDPSWVWVISSYFADEVETRFVNIPDSNGTIEHTELISINPSTLPASYDNVEPSWWAELRQYHKLITEALRSTGKTEQEYHDALHDVIERTRKYAWNARGHETAAGAYAKQSRNSATEAWEASKGPDGAAARAKEEADRAEIYRNETNSHRIASNQEADRAKDEADRAETQADLSQSSATVSVYSASRAEADADRAEQEADRSKDEADRSENAARIWDTYNTRTPETPLPDYRTGITVGLQNDDASWQDLYNTVYDSDQSSYVVETWKTGSYEHRSSCQTIRPQNNLDQTRTIIRYWMNDGWSDPLPQHQINAPVEHLIESPNGQLWQLTVDNDGTLTVESHSEPEE